jgi:hypothetical protein
MLMMAMLEMSGLGAMWVRAAVVAALASARHVRRAQYAAIPRRPDGAA